MPTPAPTPPISGAVFLSYARDDAAAARRIAEALRSRGIEVWFDENELRGGDAWDAKIRQQINDCTLFVPLISQHTEERSKGYFRLEWKLAVEQTHLLAEGVPFLAPVVIDDTRETGAVVPAEFLRVQWTRLPGALPTPQFVEQIKRLLAAPAPPAMEAGRPRPARRAEGVASPAPQSPSLLPIVALAAIAIAVVAIGTAVFIALRPGAKEPAVSSKPPTVAAATPPAPAAPALDDKSVAVLAFVNLSGDKDSEYFSDGISEELLNVLAKVPGLRVAARTSAFFFKDKNLPIAEIAQKLNVAYVVEGSVQRAGENVRITAQLIKTADGYHVWSEHFDRELKNIFAVQDEIAGLIAKNLSLKLGGVLRVARVVNPEAHRLVLEGRYFWLLRTEEGFARAEAAYTKALEIDPQFAVAHAGLADVWAIRGWYRLLGGMLRADDDFARAKVEVQQALRLDPTLAEPYAALGGMLFNEHQFAESEQQFQQALRLNPNYSFTHHWHAQLLMAEGRIDAALEAFERALQLDPLAFIILTTDSLHLAFAWRYPEALAISDRALALRPGVFVPAQGERALILLGLGRKDEAVAAARLVIRNVTQPRWWEDANAIYVLRQAGLEQEAADYAARLLATLPAESYLRGFIFAALGRKDEALAHLALAGAPSLAIGAVLYTPLWDGVRDDPRFPKIIAKLGYTAEYKLARATLARMLKEQVAKK